MMWSSGGYGAAWTGFALIHILLWGLVIAGIVVLLRWALRNGAHGERRTEEGRALDILRERYARGEIDVEEFKERKQVLNG